MERLTAFHKPVIDAVRAPLLSSLAQTTGMLQSLVLEVLQRRAGSLQGLMTDVQSVLPALLASRNHALQNNALKLTKALLPAEPDEPAGEQQAALLPESAVCMPEDCTQSNAHHVARQVKHLFLPSVHTWLGVAAQHDLSCCNAQHQEMRTSLNQLPDASHAASDLPVSDWGSSFMLCCRQGAAAADAQHGRQPKLRLPPAVL